MHSFYIQLLPINFVLVLIGKFDQKLNFNPDWPEQKAKEGPIEEKM